MPSPRTALPCAALMAMLMGVKAKSFEKKDLLTADEFKAIADSVLQAQPV